jgi:hypothetical protein
MNVITIKKYLQQCQMLHSSARTVMDLLSKLMSDRTRDAVLQRQYHAGAFIAVDGDCKEERKAAQRPVGRVYSAMSMVRLLDDAVIRQSLYRICACVIRSKSNQNTTPKASKLENCANRLHTAVSIASMEHYTR